MRFIAYRNLIGVSHSEAEAKAEAEEVQVCDSDHDWISLMKNQITLNRIQFSATVQT